MKLIFTDLMHSKWSSVCHLRNNVFWHFKKWVMDNVCMCFFVCVCLSVFVDQVNRYIFLKHSVFLIDFHNSHRFTILTLIYFLFYFHLHVMKFYMLCKTHRVAEQSLIWLPLDLIQYLGTEREDSVSLIKNFQRELSY